MDLFFLMRSSRLNILAAELFSLVTEVQTVTGWSQLVFQPGVSRSDKPGDSIFSSSGRWEGWCGAQHQHLDWPHRVNVCPYPEEAAQLSWCELLQLISCLRGGRRLSWGSNPSLVRREPAEIIPVQTPQDTLSYCSLFLLMWSSLKGYWGLDSSLLEVTGDCCFPQLQNQGFAFHCLDSEVSKKWSRGHQHIEHTSDTNLCQLLTRSSWGSRAGPGSCNPFLGG